MSVFLKEPWGHKNWPQLSAKSRIGEVLIWMKTGKANC